MSSRNDITEYVSSKNQRYGLIYTKQCGWIDLGHANPEGARALWKDILVGQSACHKEGYSKVTYKQSMRKIGLTASAGKTYQINDSLNLSEQRSVALSIFLDVTLQFESMQSNWFYSLFTDSGFSSEDVASDILGFYRALYPKIDFLKQCEPMPKAYALKVWDRFGAVGASKIRGPGIYLYEIDIKSGRSSAQCANLPPFLNTVAPAKQGALFTSESDL